MLRCASFSFTEMGKTRTVVWHGRERENGERDLWLVDEIRSSTSTT